jgi:hypothetical protein
LQTASEVAVAAVVVNVPAMTHTVAAVQVVGFDAVLAYQLLAQALHMEPVKPVLQVHAVFAVELPSTLDAVPAVQQIDHAEHVVGEAAP